MDSVLLRWTCTTSLYLENYRFVRNNKKKEISEELFVLKKKTWPVRGFNLAAEHGGNGCRKLPQHLG